MGAQVKTIEANKVQTKAAAESAVSKVRVRDFVEEVKAEVHRVTWTNRDELQVYTKIVVASTLIFGLGIYCTDLIIQGVLNGMAFFIHLIGG